MGAIWEDYPRGEPLESVFPPPNRGAMGLWALGQPPKGIPPGCPGNVWYGPRSPSPSDPRGGGPWHPPLFWGGKYSHESKFIVNVLVIC